MNDEPNANADANANANANANADAKGEVGAIAGVVIGLFLLVALWGGGTWFAHWLWGFGWFVSALLAPAALAALFVAVQIYSTIRR